MTKIKTGYLTISLSVLADGARRRFALCINFKHKMSSNETSIIGRPTLTNQHMNGINRITEYSINWSKLQNLTTLVRGDPASNWWIFLRDQEWMIVDVSFDSASTTNPGSKKLAPFLETWKSRVGAIQIINDSSKGPLRPQLWLEAWQFAIWKNNWNSLFRRANALKACSTAKSQRPKPGKKRRKVMVSYYNSGMEVWVKEIRPGSKSCFSGGPNRWLDPYPDAKRDYRYLRW